MFVQFSTSPHSQSTPMLLLLLSQQSARPKRVNCLCELRSPIFPFFQNSHWEFNWLHSNESSSPSRTFSLSLSNWYARMNTHTRNSDLVAFHVFQLIFNISNATTTNDDDDEDEDGKLRYVFDKKDAIFNYMWSSIPIFDPAVCHIPRNFPFIFSRYGILLYSVSQHKQQ